MVDKTNLVCLERFPVLIRRPLDSFSWQFNSSTFICPLSHEQTEKTKGHDFNLTRLALKSSLLVTINVGRGKSELLTFLFLVSAYSDGAEKGHGDLRPSAPCADQVLAIISPQCPRGQPGQVIISAAQFQFNILLPEAPLSVHPTFWWFTSRNQSPLFPYTS